MSTGKYRKDHNCLNCGFHVDEHYCSRCGQPNVELKESFWTFIAHSIAHYFHFDSKFFQTLTPLLTKPGLVTLDYIAGRRARYINPVNLYIFVSIVYFLVVPNAKVDDSEKNATVKHKYTEKLTTAKDLDSARKELDSDLGEFGGVVKYSVGKATSKYIEKHFEELSFKEQQNFLSQLTVQHKSSDSSELGNLLSSLNDIHQIKKDSTYEAYLANQQKLAENDRDDWITRQIKKREIKVNAKSAKGDWTIGEEIKKYQPKQYFLLMPLLAFFIMLNFRKNHIYYLDHLIFTIHGMTAYFIVSIFCYPAIKYIFGIDSFVSEIIELGIIIWICWYLYKGLKVFYNRTRGVIIRKMVTLFLLYALSLYITENLIRNVIYYILT
ncbi:MAG: DUF3667 domain-containing protein [Pedobacter sp.]|nr:MAG: DUF3667 domain-containing protein [Pedobacter sp.]